MKTKICTKCGIEKNLTEFYLDKRAKDGKQFRCKECIKKYQEEHKKEILIYQKKYHLDNKEEIKKYLEDHKEEIAIRVKKYRDKRKEETKIYNKKWRENHKEYQEEHTEETKIYHKKYQQEHKEKLNKISQKYYEEHKEEIAIKAKKYREAHKEEINKRQNQRRKTDIRFKIKCNLITRIYDAIRRNTKSMSTMFLIGCEHDYLLFHLQSQFKNGMTWDNYGEWHIDHIRPCASFDLSRPEEQCECFHYSNLQPLWAKDNLIKNDKWEGTI